MNDEAVTVLGARRWLNGEWPYRDWHTRFSPGSYALAAAFFLFTGVNQAGTRSLMLLLISLQGLVLFELSRGLPGKLRYLPWLLWSLIGIQEFPIFNYHWVSVLAFSLLTLAARYWLERGTSRSAAGVGGCLALCGWILQSEGLAGTLLVALAAWRGGRQKGVVVASTLLCSVLLWCPFLLQGSQVWQNNGAEMSLLLRFNFNPYGPSHLLPPFLGAWQSSPGGDPLGWAHAWALALVYAFKYGGFYLILAIHLWRQRGAPSAEQVLGWACLALALANANRQTLEYQSFLCPIWFVIAVSVLRRAVWPVLALVLLHWTLNLAVESRDRRFAITTPSGVYWTSEEWEAQAYNKLGQWIRGLVVPGQEAACLPYQCCLYTLWNLPNPLAEPVLIPLSYPLASFEQAHQRMLHRKTRWLIYTPLSPEGIASTYRVPAAQFAEAQQAAHQVLVADFHLRESLGGMELWELRARK